MRDKYIIIGCSLCKQIFFTKSKLVARCPNCAHQIPLYKNDRRIFYETTDRSDAKQVAEALYKKFKGGN